MIRFIFVCMAVVALSAVFTATQFVTDGINGAREDVLARNTPASVEPAATGADDDISFEEIYANAKSAAQGSEAFYSPEDLNSIDTAAGGQEFSAGFTGDAPKALAEPVAQLVTEQPSAE